MSRAPLVFLVIFLPLGLGACGSLGHGKNPSTAATKKSTWFSVPDLFPSQVQVVKARQKDLKPLPLGHERALAFDKQRETGFWTFGGPADFVQPALPEPGAEMDGSLLPPKTP